MGKLDALSRRANHGSGQGDNNNLTLLAPELFCIHALAEALDRRREFEEGEEWLTYESRRTDTMLEWIHRGQDDASF
jgi:hypothetical protein